MRRNVGSWLAGVLVLVAVALGGWWLLKGEAADGGARREKRAVTVEVARVVQADVPLTITASGQVSPLQTLEVRPQVSGVVARVLFREGQTVKPGELLFQLEDAAERAALAEARAQLRKDTAQLEDARRTLASNQKLQAEGFLAPQALDSSRNAVQSAVATVEADKAAIQAAENSLSYKTIRAAIGGRAGLINVYRGSVVSLSMATPMVTITQLDPISISFSVPERELPRLIAAQRQGPLAVTATLPGQERRFEGRLVFIDNTVDPKSGTLRLKAEFPNADHALWPGLFANVSLEAGIERNAVVLPVAGLQTGPEGKFVYRVDNGRARAQPVEVLDIREEKAIVRGLAPDSVVVTRGGLNLRSGDAVSIAGAKQGTNAVKPSAKDGTS